MGGGGRRGGRGGCGRGYRGDAMRLLGWLWRRLMRQAANAMLLLGRLMRWLMRVADEGG